MHTLCFLSVEMATCLRDFAGLFSVLLSSGYGRYNCNVWKPGIPVPGDTHVCVTIGYMLLPDRMGNGKRASLRIVRHPQ